MGFWSSFKGLWNTGKFVEKVDGSYFYPLSLSHHLERSGHDFDTIQNNALFYTILSKAADFITNAEFEVRDIKTGEYIDNDPIYKLFEQPNELQTLDEYMRSWLYALKMDGVSWINSLGGVGFERNPERTKLVVLPCLKIQDDYQYDLRDLTLNPERLQEIPFYYETNEGEIVKIRYKDLIPAVDNTSSASDPFKYLSPIKAAALIGANSNLRLEADNVLTGKPGGLGIISSGVQGANDIAIPISPDEKKAVEEKLSGKFGTAFGKAHFVVSSAALKFQAIAQTIKDFGIPEHTESDYMKACNVMGIPKDLIIKDSTYENYRYAQIDYYQSGAMRVARLFADVHTKYFGYREQGKEIIPTFDHLPVMFAVKKEQATHKNTMADFYAKAFALGGDPAIISERINDLL